MTHLEYIAVAVSLICSCVAVRLLGGTTEALRPGTRYGVHVAWLFLVLRNVSVL